MKKGEKETPGIHYTRCYLQSLLDIDHIIIGIIVAGLIDLSYIDQVILFALSDDEVLPYMHPGTYQFCH